MRSFEKYLHDESNSDESDSKAKEELGTLLNNLLGSIPDRFDSSEQLRGYQDKLRNDFKKKKPEEQERIMDTLGDKLGQLSQDLEQKQNQAGRESIRADITKTRFLLMTFHSIYRLAQKREGNV